MKKYKLILLAVLISAGFTSCSEDDDAAEVNGNTANVRFELTDAPGDYDEVKIEVTDVLIQTETSMDDEGADEEGWVSIGGVQTEIINLLDLTGGVTHLLGETELEAGRLNQIRLVLGSGNSVVVDGTSYTLSTPSAQQSGLKLQVNKDLEAGVDYVFLLDFDVEESVVKAGESGNYILKPVIRVSTQEAGSIVGSVHPTNFQSLVKATNGSTTVSAYTDADGKFALHGLAAGSYMVTITPAENSGYVGTTINNVTVTEGSETDLEVTFLTEEGTGTEETATAEEADVSGL